MFQSFRASAPPLGHGRRCWKMKSQKKIQDDLCENLKWLLFLMYKCKWLPFWNLVHQVRSGDIWCFWFAMSWSSIWLVEDQLTTPSIFEPPLFAKKIHGADMKKMLRTWQSKGSCRTVECLSYLSKSSVDLKDGLKMIDFVNPRSINDQTKLLHVLLILRFGLSVQAPLAPLLCRMEWGASTFGHQTLRISYVGSRHQNPGHQDLSGESHLIVSHSHVSRIIHGNQDRLGIPCWEDLVSLGANASIQNMRFSWIWGFQLACFWSWEMPSIYRSFHDVPSFPHKFRGAEIVYICTVTYTSHKYLAHDSRYLFRCRKLPWAVDSREMALKHLLAQSLCPREWTCNDNSTRYHWQHIPTPTLYCPARGY